MTDDRLNAIKARLYSLRHAPNPYERYAAREALYAHAEDDLAVLVEANEELAGRLDAMAELLDAADEALADRRGDAQLADTKGATL